jgi:hypothetical protein
VDLSAAVYSSGLSFNLLAGPATCHLLVEPVPSTDLSEAMVLIQNLANRLAE